MPLSTHVVPSAAAVPIAARQRTVPSANQPAPPLPVHYTPTRLLAGAELDAFRKFALVPIEQLTDHDIKECPIPRLKAYISIYRARITNMRPPRIRRDFDRFFLAWFRHMCDRGEIQPRRTLPIYLPQVAPTADALQPARPHCAIKPHSPFSAHTDPGFLKLPPLKRRALSKYYHPSSPSPRGPRAWYTAFDQPASNSASADHDTRFSRPIHEAVAALLQQYGMYGRAWDRLGHETIFRACDYLSSFDTAADHSGLASEGVILFLEELSDLTLAPLSRLMQERDPSSVSDTLVTMPLVGNGVCSQLMQGDRSGIRRI